MSLRKVFKITDEIDPSTVLCTTYQMRNFYNQFRDGFFSSLDVMNYMQHDAVVRMSRKGDQVLDVCCGRGLTLPLFRWYRKNIGGYTGVDIEPKNQAEILRRSGARDIRDFKLSPAHDGDGEPYYPFPVHLVEANVAEMFGKVPGNYYDLVIYTSSIEHMQREAGAQSLRECYNAMKLGGRLFLSSPNTEEKRDPYDTQYAAHLYEWPREELLAECEAAGFTLVDQFGLVAKVRGYRDKLVVEYPELVPMFDRLAQYMPSAWLYGMFPVLTPTIADEILFVLEKK